MLLNRQSLKDLFKKGKFPSENHFSHLIDSTVNKVEDGFGKTPEEGLQLAPKGDHDQLLSAYQRMDQSHPDWQLNFRRGDEAKGLSFDRIQLNDDQKREPKSRLFLSNEGKVGIGTTKPWAPFEVNGTAGLQSRVGTFKYGAVPGDGKWHAILCELDGLHAYEIVARINGRRGKGKYAFTHAIALSTFGGRHSRKKIKQTRAYYGWYWNRIELRWKGDIKNFELQVRTRQSYGNDDNDNIIWIKYHITRLWDEQLFDQATLPPNDCAKKKKPDEKPAK